MIKIKKCRSIRHRYGGCGNPRCPEGLSIKAALDEAVKNHDLNSFLAAKDMEGAEPAYLRIDRGMMNMTLSTNGKNALFKYPVSRPEVRDYIQSIDKSQINSFDDVDSMESYLNELYKPYARVRLHEYRESDNTYRDSGFDLKSLSVGDMHVDADVRGLGVGRHMRATILKFADEHNYVVTGTPTENGDGTLEQTSSNYEEFKAHALAHKARLEKFYLDSGYEYNHAYIPVSPGTNYWTGERYEMDMKWEEKLHPSAANFLRESGFYVRWPNNEIPKNWKAGARKPRKKSSPL
jgi:GNAT superfamily N-acetyltransferase